jgi:hypothetical protein
MLKHIKKTIIFLLVFGLGFMTAYITTNNSFKSISMDNNESIYIISPKSGAEVINPAGTKKTNTGHHHLLINLEKLPDLKSPLPSNENLIHFGLGQTETEVRLKKGINTLQLVLGDHMHKPHEPPLISKKIKIIVR